jgi:hypothetical protein
MTQHDFKKALANIPKLGSTNSDEIYLWFHGNYRTIELSLKLAEKSQWQPIETAPEDDDAYLFYTASGRIRTGRRYDTISQDDWETIIYTNEAYLSCCEVEEVTHWMPLPEPPLQAVKEVEG